MYVTCVKVLGLMNMNTKTLQLYLKALSHKPSTTLQSEHSLPNMCLPTVSCQRQESINAKHCTTYNQLTKWQPGLASLVHPNYIQTLSLPLQLEMMVHKDFPFAPMGMVHVANQISVNKLPSQADKLHLQTYFGGVFYHKKGWLFELVTTASSANNINDDAPDIKATSFYLARTKHADAAEAVKNHAKQAPDWISSVAAVGVSEKLEVNFASNIGRQYAKVSGDYNPIHLHNMSAKFFGFKKAIAHGMFSKALTVSNIAKKHRFYQSPFTIDTVFKHAIALPANTILNTRECASNTINFNLSPKTGTKEHIFLHGNIRF